MIAVHADGREIDNGLKLRRAADGACEMTQHRIAVFIGRHGYQHGGHIDDRRLDCSRFIGTVEDECFDLVSAYTHSRNCRCLRARRDNTGDTVKASAEYEDEVRGRIAEAEAE